MSNCSNHGACILVDQSYVCQCNENRTGSACQTDSRPCSRVLCMNGSTCYDTNNSTSFQCTCRSEIFHGTYCENKVDLCKNSTICYNNQGFCVMNDTQPFCKCKTQYSGVNCEIMSNYLVFQKGVVWLTTIICIIVIVCLIMIVLGFDFTKYFLMNKNKGNKPAQRKPVIKRYIYHP